jgi:hypothetical protein
MWFFSDLMAIYIMVHMINVEEEQKVLPSVASV